MNHLPGFWDEENWGPLQYCVYVKRRRGWWNRLMNWKDQRLHRLLGCTMTRSQWEAREAAQWPSKTGSYDPAEDHWNWLVGAGHRREAEAFRDRVYEVGGIWLS